VRPWICSAIGPTPRYAPRRGRRRARFPEKVAWLYTRASLLTSAARKFFGHRAFSAQAAHISARPGGPSLDDVGELSKASARLGRIARDRVGKRHRQQRRLPARQLAGRYAEVMPRRRFYTVDARPPFCDVE